MSTWPVEVVPSAKAGVGPEASGLPPRFVDLERLYIGVRNVFGHRGIPNRNVDQLVRRPKARLELDDAGGFRRRTNEGRMRN
jgi:hypothetical protein